MDNAENAKDKEVPEATDTISESVAPNTVTPAAEAPLSTETEAPEVTPAEAPPETSDAPVPAPAEETAPGSPEPAVAPEPAPAPVASPASQPPKQSNTALVAIVMAVVVALGLGAIGFMTYMKAQNSVQENTGLVSPEPAPAPAPAAPAEVQPDDVDKAASDIDSSIEALDENQDFNEEDLSDEALGIE